MAKMTEAELRALTDAGMRDAIPSSTLSDQRAKAQYYYLGLPYGDLAPPEVEGRSAVVVPYVRNVAESMLPQLMVKFTGGDQVVEFEAQRPDDEQRAKTATEYLNYLFWKKNPGHRIAYTWMKDALLQKVGIVKVWWDQRTEETTERYKGLSEIELLQVLEDDEVEAAAQNVYPDPEDAKQREQAINQATQQLQALQPGDPQAEQVQAHIAQIQGAPLVLLYDIEVHRRRNVGKVTIENVPPEEFLISRDAKSIAEASFVGHRVARTRSELKSMGYKNVDKLTSDEGTDFDSRLEWTARNAFDDEQDISDGWSSDRDKSQQKIWLTECYVRCDWDGDGISELRKVTRAGNEILDNEEADEAPFVAICPIPLPHKFHGLSIADLGMETQKTETSILRSQLDNMYLQVNGRYFAVENQVNLDDLLTSRPGGVVRIKTPGAVGRLDQAMGDSAAGMGMLEYMQQFGEAATGWTRYSQGNDAKAIQGTATGANIITNKDDMRLDLIARNFAEGWTELFRMMLKLVCQHQDRKAEVKLSGGWVDINPREWRNGFDCQINVGLGVGNKDQQIAHIMAVIAQQEKVHAIGVATPENIYASSAELAKLTGQRNGEKFFTDPAKAPPPPPPPPDPEMVKAQAAQQLEQTKGQVTLEVERMKAEMKAMVDRSAQQAQLDQETATQQIQAQVDAHKAELDARAEQQKLEHDAILAKMKLDAEEARNIRDNETKIYIAQMGHEASANQIGAQNSKVDEKDDNMTQVLGSIAEALMQLRAPRTIIRDASGRAQGIQ